MKRKRREIDIFSMSFLDVICCGFGAVILLMMITKVTQPQVLEASTRDLHKHIAALQEEDGTWAKPESRATAKGPSPGWTSPTMVVMVPSFGST